MSKAFLILMTLATLIFSQEKFIYYARVVYIKITDTGEVKRIPITNVHTDSLSAVKDIRINSTVSYGGKFIIKEQVEIIHVEFVWSTQKKSN